ncbi:MAG: STAS domain-containing protein [Deltaproteobacteria bacterium]|nr:STAS domain-containing protein [Deltaproteobacteria bacterium]
MKKLLSYMRSSFRHDLIAGIVVGLVALPLAIAFAVASGARPEQGIYTSIIAGIAIGLASGSKFQVSGPTGAFVIILLGIVNAFGIGGLLIAGCMAGIILVLMGLFRFGSIIKYIPYPVIIGFTSGIGLLIFTSQLSHFFGISSVEKPHGWIQMLTMLFHHLPRDINVSSLAVGSITLFVSLFWRKIHQTFPAAPIALLVGTILSLFLGHTPVVGAIPTGLPHFQLLNFSWSWIPILLPSAFTIAVLGAIESLLSAIVADGMAGTKHNSNQELIAQGVGNIIIPFFGGIPATGAIARTAMNIRNGAKTRMASVVHSIVLIVIVLFFAPYAEHIPMAALAAILMVVAYRMSEAHHFRKLLTAPLPDVFVLLTTFFLTLFVDLTIAVGAGVVLASLLFIKNVSEITINTLEDNTQTGSSAALALRERVKDYPLISLYEVNGPMFFGAASFLEDQIAHKQHEILILTLKNVPVIDASAMHALDLIVEDIQQNNGKIILVSLQPQVLRALWRHGTIQKLGGEDFVARNIDEAIERAKEMINQSSSQGNLFTT